MSKDSTSNYSYDPFGSGSHSRWGRRGAPSDDVPQIAGYEIIDALGTGGMGSVWSARFLSLNQIRAVKVLDRSLAADPSFVERFTLEAKALGRLEHPHIVKVFDANAEHDPPYLAMEWVEGSTLADVLRKRKVSVNEAVAYFEQVAGALDHAHSLGFVHRDIKPSNVMITDKGKAMLIDFGVASLFGTDPSQSNTITGTTRYLSPEVCQGKNATAASDVWALAVMMYRVFVGSLPFDDKDGSKVINKILQDAPAAPKGVSGRLGKFLIASLDKDPKNRPKSASQLVAGLKRATGSIVPLPQKEGATLTASYGLIAAAFVAVGAVFGGVFWAMNQGGRSLARAGQTEMVAVGSNPTFQAPTVADTTEPISPVTRELRGVWFADFGSRYGELLVSPSGGRKFAATMRVRSSEAVTVVAVEGEVTEDGKAVNFKEMKMVSASPSGKYELGQFKGTLSEDRARMAGVLTGTSASKSVRILRAADLPLSASENSQDGFVANVPMGWSAATATEGTASDIRSTTIAPIGYPQVMFRVTAAPETQGRTLEQVFEEREKAMQAATSGYQRSSFNASATLGGRKAFAWEFRSTSGGVAFRNSITAVLRNDVLLTVETSVPVSEEETWTPVLDRLIKKFMLTDPAATPQAPPSAPPDSAVVPDNSAPVTTPPPSGTSPPGSGNAGTAGTNA